MGHYAYQCFKKRKEQPKPKSKPKSNRKNLISELDRVTSELVRRQASDSRGFAYCFTCGVRKPWQELDCGHYRSRRYIQTRFDLDNLRPQCKSCNRYQHGNLSAYREKLVRELGELKVQEIERRPSTKLLELELENLIQERKQAIAKLPTLCNN